MGFYQVLFVVIALCLASGCALPERGDPSLLYYRDDGLWFSEATNDYLAEMASNCESLARVDCFRRLLDLQGKPLRFTVQEWGKGSERLDHHLPNSISRFMVTNVESGSPIDPVLKEWLDKEWLECVILVSNEAEGWLRVDIRQKEPSLLREDDDMLSVRTFDMAVSTNLLRRFKTRSVSPASAYPFVKDVLGRMDGIRKPLVLAPMMRCNSNDFVFYSLPDKEFFRCGIPAEGFDTETFREHPWLFVRPCGSRLIGDGLLAEDDILEWLRTRSEYQNLAEKIIVNGTIITGR